MMCQGELSGLCWHATEQKVSIWEGSGLGDSYPPGLSLTGESSPVMMHGNSPESRPASKVHLFVQLLWKY
jgi:hypothetical protein